MRPTGASPATGLSMMGAVFLLAGAGCRTTVPERAALKSSPAAPPPRSTEGTSSATGATGDPPRVLRIRARGAPARLFVFLHGVGASGDDLLGVASALAPSLPDAEMLLPDGFREMPGRPGRRWWHVEGMTDENRPQRIRAAGVELEAWLGRELKARSLGFERLALIGFSQGAALGVHLGVRRTLAGVVSMCGRPGEPGSGPVRTPFLLIHGALDPLVPPAEAAAFAAALQDRGANVTYALHPRLGHGIDREAVEEARAFLSPSGR